MAIIEVENVRPHKKRGFWFYIRRVPAALCRIDKRTIVFLSTGIRVVDDPLGIAARAKVAELNTATEQRWQVQAAGIEMLELLGYVAAVVNANLLGFPYKLRADLLPEEIQERVRAALETGRDDDDRANKLIATMGSVKVPSPTPAILEHLARISRSPA